MKKQLMTLALCVSVLMTNNAYSMAHSKDVDEEVRQHRVVPQPQEQAPVVTRRVAPQFQYSDLNPCTWSFNTQCRVATGVLFLTYTGWLMYKCVNLILAAGEEMRNLPKQCKPEINWNLASDDHSFRLSSDVLPDAEPVTLILQETVRNATHTVCRYLVNNSCCGASADLVYDNCSLQGLIFNKGTVYPK